MWELVQGILERSVFTAPGGGPITVSQIISVLALFAAAYLVSRFAGFLIGRRLTSTRLGPDATAALKRIVFVAALVVVFLLALQLLGVPITAFAFALGAIAIAVGFGAQNILSNFISGWILMAERPIKIGDFIEFDAWQGTVERIGNRSTRIRRIDGVHLLVPNSQLLERTVVNWTLVDQNIRTTVRVGVAYGSPVRQVADLILGAVREQPETLPEPHPHVVFEDFGDSALIFDAYFWCEVGGDKLLREINSEVRFRIVQLFEENGIVIAFPQRDVHIDASEPLPVRVLPEESAE
ncbi:MAG: mechanosensitive ion channel [Gammaproteobacteria bacterium]|nr:mechanosensitive ion channel [Gammaproteobacteria bacterium]MDE0412726.1 mechanosensitive ion channel [Gammaproteobacteria bacterium]